MSDIIDPDTVHSQYWWCNNRLLKCVCSYCWIVILFTVSFNVILNFLFYASNFYLLYFHILCLNISYVKIYLTAADKTCAESSVKVRIVTFCPWRPSGPLAPAGPWEPVRPGTPSTPLGPGGPGTPGGPYVKHRDSYVSQVVVRMNDIVLLMVHTVCNTEIRCSM